jgi:hypothetical protein
LFWLSRYKDDTEIEASEKWKISDGGERYKLELLDCQLDDAGVYKVVVSNVLGSASENCTLGVICTYFLIPLSLDDIY